jgi:hypothetical protein
MAVGPTARLIGSVIYSPEMNKTSDYSRKSSSTYTQLGYSEVARKQRKTPAL